MVDGKTPSPGGSPVTITGTPVTLGSDGKLTLGSSTTKLPTRTTNGAVFTAGGLVFTEEFSDVVVESKTLFPGGPPITLGLDGKISRRLLYDHNSTGRLEHDDVSGL